MKHSCVIFVGLALLLLGCVTKNSSVPERINIDFGWSFSLGDIVNGEKSNVDYTTWEKIDLPHDWSIAGVISKDNPSGKNGGYYPGGVGWYRKVIQWDKAWENKQVTITFDGVYMNSDVWINGHHLGKRPNGYIGFSYNLTPYLTIGKNIIAVRVDNSKQPSGRWYTGCGIYRHVWLDVKNKVHIPISGSFVTFSDIDSSSAKMHIETKINNTDKIEKHIVIETKLLTADKTVVNIVYREIDIKENISSIVKQSFIIKKPHLWSVDNPYLYEVVTTIKEGGVLLDTNKTTVGIRSIRFDAQTGFWLNENRLKIKGVCMHHEAGSLGSAVPKDVWERRIVLLKEMGCNAIRTSHTPFRSEFYDLCDSLGMLVMNEAFDGWDTPKAKFDYGLYFEKWWKPDLTDFIKRDRNHPSIIMWSIGNEVRKRTDSIETLLVDLVHKLDPTRPVTIGAGHDAIIGDIAGFNGHGEFPNRLEKIHEEHPDWPIVGTEVPHSWQTRGIYRTKTWWRGRDFPAPWAPKSLGREPRKGTYFPIPDLTEQEVFENINSSYLSSYDNATVRISARDQWKRTSKFDFMIGEFRWTGFDYLGENIWPNRGWHCGVIDLAGFPKDHYYFYQSAWAKKLMVHILPHWTHPGKEGVIIPVVVYSNCEQVELFLNDKSMGIKKDTANDLRLLWYVPYEVGTLKAIAMHNGKEVMTEHVTAGKAYALQLSTDKTRMDANKRSVAHITIKVVDEHGNFVPEANIPFTYEIKGPAKLLAIENGDMLDLSLNKAEVKKTFNGLSLMYIQSVQDAGDIEVIVKSKGLVDGTISIQTLLNKKKR